MLLILGSYPEPNLTSYSPPYFALVIRAIGVLEGIALVGNPNFAIIDEAYPYIARRLMTDDSPRLKTALRYMVYGREGVFDAEKLIDLLQALEKFTAVTDEGDGSAFKVSLPIWCICLLAGPISRCLPFFGRLTVSEGRSRSEAPATSLGPSKSRPKPWKDQAKTSETLKAILLSWE